jgi:rhodanese-related sulfurtransferase
MKTAMDLVAEAQEHVTEISVKAAETAIREADVLLDVREKDEYAAGHLPGAINITRGMLEFILSSSPQLSARDLRFVVYCKTSGRATLAAATMRQMGYLNVQSIVGGYDTWVASGRPVVRPELPSFG